MKIRPIFTLATAGLLAGVVSAYLFGIKTGAQPPAFTPASNPYEQGIYANGIIESDQPHGENINIYPEVSGVVREVVVNEGDSVSTGTVLLRIDDSVQRAAAEQQKAQAAAAHSLVQELEAQPRKENLAVADAQVTAATASLKTTQDQFDKIARWHGIDATAVSKDTLDNADNARRVAAATLDVARRQLDLLKAGAWSYDIESQRKQYDALNQAFEASNALLAKYTLRAPVDGVVLSANAAVGSYVSAQGSYDTYTQGNAPVFVMSRKQEYLSVRCYIDEILIGRLPAAGHIRAQMSLRGSDVKIPLEFVRVQPYVSPKISLSNQRQERVDLRVLPVIFRFPKNQANVYPGQMVDVYVGHQ